MTTRQTEVNLLGGCRWPAYYDNIEGAVERHVDNAHGMRRVEITCAKCGGHLGELPCCKTC